MKLSEALLVNAAILVVVLVLLCLGSGCTTVVSSDDPQWEYPVQ